MVLLFVHPGGDGLGLYARLQRAGGAAAPRRLHRDDHVGERVPGDHPEPDDRGRRPEGRADAGSEVRGDRQAALDAQQLPDAAGPVPDAVEPLSAGVRDRVQLADRQPGLPDGRDHPALFQHRCTPGKGSPNWTWAATAIIFVIIMWLSSAPGSQREELAAMSPMRGDASPRPRASPTVADTVRGRCSMCHTAEPGWPGVHRAPKGVILETDAEIAAHAREIYLQAGPQPCDAAGERHGDRAGASARRSWSGTAPRSRAERARLRLARKLGLSDPQGL